MAKKDTYLYDEKRIIAQIKRGNLSAFDELYAQYSKRLYAFIYGYLKSHENTEEIIQDIFIKIWENRNKLKEDLSFNSYIFTIAKNNIFNCFRKRANEESYKKHLMYTQDLVHTKTEDDLVYADLEKLANLAIEQLPPKRKQIFILSRRKGMTYQEIADHLAISTSTVEIQMSKALKYLKEHLSYHNSGISVSVVLLFLHI